jgi:HK97 gp10 family phage protein
MAKRSGASLANANKLIKRFQIIPDAVFDEAEKVIDDQAKDIQHTASMMSPVGEGELSKKVKKRKTRKQKVKVRGSVYSNADHSIHTEFGTAEISPQPYFRPAARKGNRLQDMTTRILAAFKKR